MKYLKFIVITLFFGVFSSANLQAQSNAIDKYFQQYVDDDRFTVVYISSKLFELIGKLDVDGIDFEDKEAEAIMDIAKDLKGLRVLVSEEDAMELYKEAKQKINTSEYEILMTVRDKDGDNVEFLVKEDANNTINELLLMVGGEDEFVLLSFVGKIDMDKISKLAKEIEDEDYDHEEEH